MNHDKENKASNRTLAVGWFDNAPFRAICGKYVLRIKEVFFAWPGVTASRPMAEWTPERKQLFFEDIAWCRNEGMELDAIFNANCYGDIAILPQGQLDSPRGTAGHTRLSRRAQLPSMREMRRPHGRTVAPVRKDWRICSGSDVRRILQRLNLSVVFAIGKKKWVPQTIGTRQPREEGKAEAGNR